MDSVDFTNNTNANGMDSAEDNHSHLSPDLKFTFPSCQGGENVHS
jgi:hypothetical protein